MFLKYSSHINTELSGYSGVVLTYTTQTKYAEDLFYCEIKTNKRKIPMLWLFFWEQPRLFVCSTKGCQCLLLLWWCFSIILGMSTRRMVLWNVTISQLCSSIPVPDVDCTPSSAPIARRWVMLPSSLYDLFWLRVCEVGLDVTESIQWDTHFQT